MLSIDVDLTEYGSTVQVSLVSLQMEELFKSRVFLGIDNQKLTVIENIDMIDPFRLRFDLTGAVKLFGFRFSK